VSYILQTDRVTKVFKRRGGGDVIAVDNVSFSIQEGHATTVAIAGESGSGKSTLALLLMGQHEPTSGMVRYLGTDLSQMGAQDRAQLRREIQPIFQDPYGAYNPFYKVDHVLQMAIKHYDLASTQAEADELIKAALEAVGLRLNETLGRYPFELSGGQRQRLMVARALICQPKIIMADEPVSMVDASLRATILSSLKALNKEYGISILYITHDLTTAYQICSNIMIMYSGVVVESGSVEQVIRHPKHPYTQLLISSIPLPDTSTRWVDLDSDVEDPVNVRSTRKITGCRFAPRCPHAMEMCWATHPEHYTPDECRAVTCFLYRDTPVLASGDVSEVFDYAS
jgi:oligopeptide/dipeptide ABC transporter ATP-binding protein